MPESVIAQRQKESHHVLDHFVRDGRWMGSIFTSYPYDLILLCTNSYPAVFFPDLISCGWMKY
jgi:hypothetical protein